MAAGKSCVGRLLSKELGWTFLDTDNEIEQATGLKIPDLFRKYGEKRFRSEESLVVRKLAVVSKMVIATGGGTILSPDNWIRLQELGYVIHLYAPLEVILQRVKNRHDRPLLNQSLAEVEKLWKERLNIYNRAHITIDTTDREIADIVEDIRAIVKGDYEHHATKN